MSRKPILLAFIVVAVGFVVFRTQRNARHELEKQRSYAAVSERTVDGHAEWSSERVRLGDCNVEWFVCVSTDPSKPQFQLVFRNAGELRKKWVGDASKNLGLYADGRRRGLKGFQEVFDDEGIPDIQVSVHGSRSILEAIFAAKKVEVEFGGKRYELDERGLANCRELLKRSEATATR